MVTKRSAPQSRLTEGRKAATGNITPKRIIPVRSVNSNLPQPLRGLGRRFVIWRHEEGKKIPLQIDGRAASAIDNSTWTTLTQALAALKSGKFDGIGVMLGDLADGHYLVGLDLDGCRDPKTGKIADWAMDEIRRWTTYCEVSPSGTGVKLYGLFEGTPPISGRSVLAPGEQGRNGKAAKIEVFAQGRYFCVTRRHVPNTPTDLRDVTVAFAGTLAVADSFKLLAKYPDTARKAQGANIDRSKLDYALAQWLTTQSVSREGFAAALQTYPHGQVHQGDKDPERQIERLWEGLERPATSKASCCRTHPSKKLAGSFPDGYRLRSSRSWMGHRVVVRPFSSLRFAPQSQPAASLWTPACRRAPFCTSRSRTMPE